MMTDHKSTYVGLEGVTFSLKKKENM